MTLRDVEEMVAKIARIPPKSVSADDKETLRNLERDLKSMVFGQDRAIEALSAAIKLSRAGLREAEKPIGNYLFSGPTGVGKTEVAGGGQGLAAEFVGLEPEEFPSERGGVAAQDADGLADRPSVPLGPGQPPSPVEPAHEDRHEEPGEVFQLPDRGRGRDQGEDRQGRPEADLQVPTAPERPESRSAAEPAPSLLDRLAGRLVVQRGQQQEVPPLVEGQCGQVGIFSAVRASMSWVTPRARMASMWSWSRQRRQGLAGVAGLQRRRGSGRGTG